MDNKGREHIHRCPHPVTVRSGYYFCNCGFTMTCVGCSEKLGYYKHGGDTCRLVDMALIDGYRESKDHKCCYGPGYRRVAYGP